MRCGCVRIEFQAVINIEKECNDTGHVVIKTNRSTRMQKVRSIPLIFFP